MLVYRLNIVYLTTTHPVLIHPGSRCLSLSHPPASRPLLLQTLHLLVTLLGPLAVSRRGQDCLGCWRYGSRGVRSAWQLMSPHEIQILTIHAWKDLCESGED